MRRLARDTDAVGARDGVADGEPVDWRALPFQLLRLVVVDRQRQRHLARHDKLRQQRVALPRRDAVGRDDVLEDLPASRVADVGEDAGKPVGVLLLDAELPLPLRAGEILPRLRQVRFLHQLRVVRLHEDVQPRPGPFTVRQDRRRDQVSEIRTLHELEDVLTVQRLELGSVGLDNVDGEPARAILLDGPGDDVLGTASPDRHLDAVFLLKRGGEEIEVGRLRRRVDADRPFLLRPLDELLQTVRARIQRDVGGGRSGLDLSGTGDREARRGRDERDDERDSCVHGGRSCSWVIHDCPTGCGSRGGRSASSASYASSMRDVRPRLVSASVNHWRIRGDSSA